MKSVSYQNYTSGSHAPAAPTISQSLHVPSDSFTSYPTDHKSDADNFETSAEPTQSGDRITQEDALYLHKQAAGIKIPPTSHGSLPVKSTRELQAQPKAIRIVPDENPLSPTYLNSSTPDQPIHALSGSNTDNHLPGQAQHASQHIKGGTWKYGLCDCGDIGVCCTGIWCPCIIYGKTQYRLSQRSERKDPTNMLGYSMFNGACAAFAVLCGCNLVLAAIQHSRLRKTYDIPGDVGTDFVRACCCCCCTLSQDEKEIKFRETQARNLSMSTTTMQYRSPVHMDFSPPPK